MYVAFSGSKVIQSNNKYYWNFVDSGDGYFYILTSDNSKAITISGTGNGSDLILTAFNGGADNQKWNKFNAGTGLLHYFKQNQLRQKRGLLKVHPQLQTQ